MTALAHDSIGFRFPLEGGGAQYEDGYELAEEDMVDDLYNLIGHPWAFRVSAG